jgi:cell division ATPase FtsA
MIDSKRLKRIFKEVKRTLWSAGVDGQAEYAWYCGGATRIEGFPEMLEEAFELPVEEFPVAEILQGAKGSLKGEGYYAQAVGLALMGSVSKLPFSANFRREEFTRKPFLLKIRLPLMIFLVVLMLGVFWDGWNLVHRRQDYMKAKQLHIGWQKQQFADFWGQENLPQDDREIEADLNWLLNEFDRRSGSITKRLTVYPDSLKAFQWFSRHLSKFPQLKINRLSINRQYIRLKASLPDKEMLQKLEDEISGNGKDVFYRPEVNTNIEKNGQVNFQMSLRLRTQ